MVRLKQSNYRKQRLPVDYSPYIRNIVLQPGFDYFAGMGSCLDADPTPAGAYPNNWQLVDHRYIGGHDIGYNDPTQYYTAGRFLPDLFSLDTFNPGNQGTAGSPTDPFIAGNGQAFSQQDKYTYNLPDIISGDANWGRRSEQSLVLKVIQNTNNTARTARLHVYFGPFFVLPDNTRKVVLRFKYKFTKIDDSKPASGDICYGTGGASSEGFRIFLYPSADNQDTSGGTDTRRIKINL